MNKRSFILSITTGLLFSNGVFAGDLPTEKDEQIVNSVIYIEEESQIDLGFDTADYLPIDFDAYAYPNDISAFNYIDEVDVATMDFDTMAYLPSGFDAYAKATKDIEGAKRQKTAK